MTTATYDETTEEFIVHSPSIEAVKWWIGDLGVYANHAIVFAQLIIKGKNHGLHAFLVPIRDKNHNLLPNVEAGDIGPKYGYQSKDNGYVKFTHHRIKREYMLMRYAKVAKDGTYTRRGNERISYATMLIIRSIIPLVCGFGLSKGVTILTRYSLVRKQFKDANDKEIKILDYQLQQEKVLPRIAEAYVISLGSNKIKEIAN
jgi:acyl-CoA oxidase